MDTATSAQVEPASLVKSQTFVGIVQQRIGWQLEDAAVIDQKIAAWMQAAPVTITLLVGLLGTVRNGFSAAVLIIAAAGLVAFAMAIATLYAAQRPRIIGQGTNWQDIAREVSNAAADDAEFHYWLAWHLAEQALVPNREIVRRKAHVFDRSVFFFVLSVTLLLLAALLSLASA